VRPGSNSGEALSPSAEKVSKRCAPDFFRRHFVATAPVLTALSEMPTARLSALEAYHRVNLKHVRRRFIPVRLMAGALAGALPAVNAGASRVLASVTTHPEKWDAVRASILAFVAQPQHWGFMGLISGGILGLIASFTMAWRMQHRLEAFGDILTVALAHRRQESLTPPSLES
jgi:hypothetical protein